MARQKNTAKRKLPLEEREEGEEPLSLWRSCYLTQVKELRLLRSKVSDKEIAKVLGITYRTFTRWLTTRPAFKAAYDEGGDLADAKVAAALHKRATTGLMVPSEKIFLDKEGNIVRAKTKTFIPPDVGAQQYWLNNKAKDQWSSTQKTELSGPQGKPIQIDERSAHDIFIERLEGLIARRRVVDGDPRAVLSDPNASPAMRTAAMIEIERRGRPKAIPTEPRTTDKGSQEPSA